jgi:3-hydroxyacyl-CoA dehydrogenase
MCNQEQVTKHMSELIEYSKKDAIVVITINNPPANALSFAVIKGLGERIEDAMSDASVTAVVITGAGRMFVSGADIREFSVPRPKDVPQLFSVLDKIERSPKPVVAALNGLAFGGGLELAMGCHCRLAAPTVQVGQPEVKLGLIPGAGGTQRLPRLAGVEAALEMIAEGDPIDANRALELGIIDEVVEGDLLARSVIFAEQAAATGKLRLSSHTKDKIGNADPEVFKDWRARIARRRRGIEAPAICVKMVEAATTMPFPAAMEMERAEFNKLRQGEQSAALRHLFFAERGAAKIPDVPRDVKPLPIRNAAIVGSGTMGGGIAICFANAGIPVTVLDASREALDKGLARVRDTYTASVSRGRLTKEEVDGRLALIAGTLDYADLIDADIVIETVSENLSLKKEIFRKLDQTCKPEAILASNTSSLNIDEIAGVTDRPAKVVGAHFFSPANVMKLLENIRTAKASMETIATLMNLSKVLDKVGVLVGVGIGFVGNRMLHVAARIAEFLVEDGAMPWQVDKALYEFGFPMGPFQVNDLAGIDVRYFTRQEHKAHFKGLREGVILDRVYGLGRYGQKTGAGWYQYEKGGRKGIPDPEVEKMILAVSEELGIKRRGFSDPEILERYLYGLINQGAQAIDEGLVVRSSDIDVIWHYGYGFPSYRGGPMYYADQVGLGTIYERVVALEDVFGGWFKPADSLRDLAKAGKRFADLGT